MSAYFPDVPPDPKLSAEEKRRIARRFRRKANLTDSCLLLSIVLFLLGTVLENANFLFGVCLLPLIPFGIGCLSTYYRCPVCGNRIVHGEYGRYLGPFTWRAYECPVCCFSPDWSR